MQHKRGIVFDLDGTLIDSYGAIAASLNSARRHFGLAELPEEEVRRMVGWGLEVLLERSLGAERVAEGIKIFRGHYARVCVSGTRLLPGAERTLRELAGRIRYLYPLSVYHTAWDLCVAHFEFRRRFWKALLGAFSCPAEGCRQRLRILFHLLPALRLAMSWRRKQIGHIHAHGANTATTVAMHAAELLGVERTRLSKLARRLGLKPDPGVSADRSN